MSLHGLAPLQRWTGDESLRHSTLQVPPLIIAYNLFMNGVDRFDQFRSTSATMRKERRVTMSIFTLVVDACVLSAHALLKCINTRRTAVIDDGTMKKRIILQLVRRDLE